MVDEPEEQMHARVVDDAKPYEVSLVDRPANPHAQIQSVTRRNE